MATYGPTEFVTKSGRRVIFRHCEPNDADAFLEFQPKIAAETTNTLQVAGRTPDREKLRDIWSADMNNPTPLRLGCFLGSKLIGQLGFHPEHHPPHPWTKHVGRFGMFILQEFWGEGIGKKLLEIMEDHARFIGVIRIEAMVRVQNERGVRLYSRMGYGIEGTRKNAAFINDRFHDELFIAKLLNESSTWSPPTLKTERLLLRPLSMTDASAIFEYAQNPNVSRYTLWEPHTTVKDSEAYVLDYALPYYRNNTPEPLGITLNGDPTKVVGTVGCFWVSKTAKTMELAYALAEPLWGKGLVAEASHALMDYCFKEYGLSRIQARCKVENQASARVMEKIGMKFEGTLRSAIFHRERYWDMHSYAVLRSEWN
ncbi:MAG: GNAT family N-acetyltransferase [Bdellovibrionaceae bacterium]|nr:GNAT family N-acetyltransferase [Pseudobdellovibrionaceae bacterium]